MAQPYLTYVLKIPECGLQSGFSLTTWKYSLQSISFGNHDKLQGWVGDTTSKIYFFLRHHHVDSKNNSWPIH